MREQSPLYGSPALAVKLIKCARIYGLRLEMKRINRGPKMDGCWKMMMPGTAGLVGVEGVGTGWWGWHLTALGGPLLEGDRRF